jgi:hypothetical protein
MPVSEASDRAKTIGYLQPYMIIDGDIILLGKFWSPDVNEWKTERHIIPRIDASKGDLGDFTALKRFANELISNDQLSKSVYKL